MPFEIVSPGDGSLYKSIPYSTKQQVLDKLNQAQSAFESWRLVPLEERIHICNSFVEKLLDKKDEIAKELTLLMGRPIKQNYGELRGLAERANHMISIAQDSLKPFQVSQKNGFKRYIRKEPLGIVFVIGSWNYPYLVTINSIIPALLAGNSVVLKHAPQTFPVSERYWNAFQEAGLPTGVFEFVHSDHPTTEQWILQDERVKHIQFTGSVAVGKKLSQLVSFKGLTIILIYI